MVGMIFCYKPLKYRGIYHGRNQLQANSQILVLIQWLILCNVSKAKLKRYFNIVKITFQGFYDNKEGPQLATLSNCKNLISALEIKINLHISLLCQTHLQNMKHCSASKSEPIFFITAFRNESGSNRAGRASKQCYAIAVYCIHINYWQL